MVSKERLQEIFVNSCCEACSIKKHGLEDCEAYGCNKILADTALKLYKQLDINANLKVSQ